MAFIFPRAKSSLVVLGAVFMCLTWSGAHGSPIRRQTASVTALSTNQIASFKPFTFYASTGYCQPSKVLNWSCGANCNANPNFQPIAAGGDGSSVQFWYVGIDPNLQTVIVAHQGTDPSKLMPLITDAKFGLKQLNATLFPGMSKSIKVHDGFAGQHAKTATSVLASVKTALEKSGLKQVTTVGHSLGAALALLDTVFLPLSLPGVTVNMIGYGAPRVGNKAFVAYVDSKLNVSRVNNKEDLIPTLPGRFVGFHHPQGEKHIQDDDTWVACSGDDNTDDKCSTGKVTNIFEGKLSDHDGPYDGVTMGC